MDKYGLYAIEHGANLILSKDSSKDTSYTLWHHVYKQGEIYHFSLKPKQTWVINWTTVDCGKKSNQVQYWYPKSETVQVIYIYHSEDFSTFKVYSPHHQNPTIINKIDAFDLTKLIISQKEKRLQEVFVEPSTKEKEKKKPRLESIPIIQELRLKIQLNNESKFIKIQNRSYDHLITKIIERFQKQKEDIKLIRVGDVGILQDIDVEMLEKVTSL